MRINPQNHPTPEFSSTYSVAAYITAYEDAEALHACLTAIKAQSYPVQQMVVVDNSPERSLLAPQYQSDPTILVWFHPENIGIAGGLKLAIAWALQQGYDFLWTFDQDSVPAPDCLNC